MESDLQNTSITDYSTNKLANHNTCATTSTTTSDLSDNNTKHKLKQHTKSNERNISIDQCDMTSLEILNKCHLDLFPKKKTICDDVNCMRIVDQLPILNGEYIHYIGKFAYYLMDCARVIYMASDAAVCKVCISEYKYTKTKRNWTFQRA